MIDRDYSVLGASREWIVRVHHLGQERERAAPLHTCLYVVTLTYVDEVKYACSKRVLMKGYNHTNSTCTATVASKERKSLHGMKLMFIIEYITNK